MNQLRQLLYMSRRLSTYEVVVVVVVIVARDQHQASPRSGWLCRSLGELSKGPHETRKRENSMLDAEVPMTF